MSSKPKRRITKIGGVLTKIPVDPIPEERRGKCTAMTTGKSRKGKHLCNAWSIPGGLVCRKHGGSAPQVRRNAQKRLLDMVDPTITRLASIRDQDVHLPSALGASNTILNRALGKPGEGPRRGESKGPTINIGIALTPEKAQVLHIGTETTSAGNDEEALDADYAVEDDDG